ncbi:MAG: universal stress protein [Segetibacter sp.]
MKNILVLTDFSESAKAAEKFALQVAIKMRVNLILYNAYPEPTSFEVNGNLVWPHDAPVSLEIRSISSLESRVRELREELDGTGPTTYHPGISHLGESGNLTKELDNVISKNTVWLVVMGTKGEGFANNLFGSSVYKVLDSVHRPVLIIPQSAHLEAVKKVTYATDLKSDDASINDWLADFAKSLDAELSIEHVSLDDDDLEEVADINATEQILYRKSTPKLPIETVQGKNIGLLLHRVIEETNVGIIAMLYRKYGFFERLFHVSSTHKMIKHTQIPVLIFPEIGKNNQ